MMPTHMLINKTIKRLDNFANSLVLIAKTEALNVGGHQLQSNFHYGDVYVNIMLSVDSHRSLSEYRRPFVDFMRTLSVDEK